MTDGPSFNIDAAALHAPFERNGPYRNVPRTISVTSVATFPFP